MGKGKKRLILLVGPKHAGKTTVGRALSALIQGDFTDLDELVEMQTGKSPRALYTEGPEIFRKAEAAALASLLDPKNSLNQHRVLATGGGLIDNVEAMGAIKQNGGAAQTGLRQTGLRQTCLLVYLAISAETAWKRIQDTAAGGVLPPFLNTANPRETHYQLHTRRAHAYRESAHFIIEAENKTADTISREIVSLLETGCGEWETRD